MLKYSPVIKDGIPIFRYKDSDYKRYWNTQIDRCINGYKPSGLDTEIPGNYYFYLNFCKIKVENKKTGRKDLQSPWYRDQDHEYFEEVKLARENKRGLIILKARDKGFSYSNNSIALHEWTFYKGNECGVGLPSDSYLKSFKNKFNDMWNELPVQIRNSRMTDNDLILKSGWEEKDLQGQWIERGYKSIIHWRTFDKPNAFRGERFSFAIMDEFGEFKDGIAAYMNSLACFMDGANQYGIPIVGGTSNQMNKSEHFVEMFYNAEKYNLKPLFFPVSKVFHGFFDKKTGISDVKGATEYIEKKRKPLRESMNKKAYYIHCQEYPLVPEDCFMQVSKTPFELDKINSQITKILQSKALQGIVQVGDLQWVDKKKDSVEWVLNPNGKYKIAYHPRRDMKNLDIGGVDSYTQETAPTSDSKGACVIFRRWTGKDDEAQNMPIAYLHDRPYTKDEWYDSCHKLSVYYGAKLLVEYTDEGFFNYFRNNKLLNCLKERPRSADSPWSKAVNKYGIPMKNYQKNLLTDLIDDYIKHNVEDIYFMDLLKELANYGIANTDLVMAFGICLMHDSDVSHLKVTDSEDEHDVLGDLPTFNRSFDGTISINKKNNNNPLGINF